MTHGCAVLVSSLGCFKDFVRDAETGFVFDHRGSQPAKALRDKIERLLEDEASLNRVAEAGYLESEKYSVERIAEKFLLDFQSVIDEAG